MVALYLAKPYLACRWSVALVWFWVIGWKLVQQWNNLETLVSRHETWSKIHLKQATWPDWSIRLLRRSNKGPLAKRSLNLWLLDRCVWILLHLPLIPVCICNLKKLQLAPPVLLILWRSFAFGGSMFRAELNPDLTISTLRNSKQILRWQRLRQTQVELENVWPNWSNLVVVFLFFSRWSNSSIFNLYGPNDLWKLKNFGMHSVFWWWSGDVSYEEIHQQRTS